jgi:hypothetical protein
LRSRHLGGWGGSTGLRRIITPVLPVPSFLLFLLLRALASYFFFTLAKFLLLDLLFIVRSAGSSSSRCASCSSFLWISSSLASAASSLSLASSSFRLTSFSLRAASSDFHRMSSSMRRASSSNRFDASSSCRLRSSACFLACASFFLTSSSFPQPTCGPSPSLSYHSAR